jgi:hypothetical protein
MGYRPVALGADPRAAVVCRQFEDVRDAVLRLSDTELEIAELVLPAVLDLTSHRLDAWWAGLAERRLSALAVRGGRAAGLLRLGGRPHAQS